MKIPPSVRRNGPNRDLLDRGARPETVYVSVSPFSSTRFAKITLLDLSRTNSQSSKLPAVTTTAWQNRISVAVEGSTWLFS